VEIKVRGYELSLRKADIDIIEIRQGDTAEDRASGK
jgi:Fe2+ transport system protein FeoA